MENNHMVLLILSLFTLLSVTSALALPQPQPQPQTQPQTPKCSIQPFTIPLRNCTFSSGTTSWGVLLEIGSPPQRTCLIPSTVVNSTLISQKSLCLKSNTPFHNQCESLRGGFFNENSSTTWVNANRNTYNDSRSNPTWDHFNPPGLTKVGWDSIRFPGSSGPEIISLHGAGLALNQYGNNSNAGMLGLGKSSVFLSDAVAQKKSPSPSWSLDSGSQSLIRPRNGELVIGGYNKARVDGSFRWTRISDMSGARPCPFRTIIKEINVLLPNGTSFPLKSSAEDITACIEPYDNLFRFTTGMLLNWKQITAFNETLGKVYGSTMAVGGKEGKNLEFTELGLPYADQKALDWSLTITLNNGYSTTLPFHEMQRPLMGWNAVGEKEEVGNVTNIAILNTPTGEGEVPTLGRIFLSRTYLTVDYPTSRFGLAEVLINPITPSTSTSTSELVPLSCNTTSSTSSSNTSNSSIIPSPAPPSSSFPLPAIVGISVGGFVILLVAIALVFWWRKRARRNRAVEAPVYEIGTASGGGGYEDRDGQVIEIGELGRSVALGEGLSAVGSGHGDREGVYRMREAKGLGGSAVRVGGSEGQLGLRQSHEHLTYYHP